MKVTLEKKISFVVAGREFDDLKVAQFFQRAIRLYKLDRETPEACAAFLIDHWNGLLFGGKNPMGVTTQQVVALVHSLQLPKAHVQKKNAPRMPIPNDNEEDDLQFKNMEPAPGELEEFFRAGLTD